jgi:hypothetical protein
MSDTSTISFDIEPSDAECPLAVEIWLDDTVVFAVLHVKELCKFTHEFADDEGEHTLRIVMLHKTQAHTKIDADGNIAINDDGVPIPDEVIFSELSPRPHDTGMVTLVSQNLSEFDLHARAILGLPIPLIEAHEGASAVVLASHDGVNPRFEGVEQALSVPGVDVRIFGKPSTRPYRRMAVALARGSNALATARAAAAKIKVI